MTDGSHVVCDLYRPAVTLRTATFNMTNSTFVPRSVFQRSVWLSEQTLITNLEGFFNVKTQLTYDVFIYADDMFRPLPMNNNIIMYVIFPDFRLLMYTIGKANDNEISLNYSFVYPVL